MDWPPPHELRRMLAEVGSVRRLAIRLGVSRGSLIYHLNKHGIRSPLRSGEHPKDGKRVVASVDLSEVDEQLIAVLRSGPASVEELANKLDRGPETIRKWLDKLRSAGYQLVERGGKWQIHLGPPAPAETSVVLEPTSGVIRFGVVSDTHLGSKLARLDALTDFYRRLASEGIQEVFHLGDLLDGHGMYRGQEWEQDVLGFDAQVQYAVANYPRVDGIRTRIIGGNHDLSYLKTSGADPLVRVAQLREDIEYLGPYSAWVKITDRFSAYLLHPSGGSSYAKSYKLQKLIESFQGGRKPNLLICGHWHDWVVLFERNVWAMLAACFQDQTDYMRRKALQPKVGGTIVTVRLDRGGEIHSFEPRFVAYLVPEA